MTHISTVQFPSLLQARLSTQSKLAKRTAKSTLPVSKSIKGKMSSKALGKYIANIHAKPREQPPYGIMLKRTNLFDIVQQDLKKYWKVRENTSKNPKLMQVADWIQTNLHKETSSSVYTINTLTKLGIKNGRKSAIYMSRAEDDGEEKELKVLEREFNRLSQRIEQVSDINYLPSLKEKIAVLNQKLRDFEKPATSANNELFEKYLASQEKNRNLDKKISAHSRKIQDLENKCNETEIKFKVLSEEARELPVEHEEGKRSPRKTKAGVLVKLLRTRYAVALGEYTQTKLKLQKELAESKEMFMKVTESCQHTANEVLKLQERIERINRKNMALINPNSRREAEYYKAATEMKARENYYAKIIQQAWRQYVKKKHSQDEPQDSMQQQKVLQDLLLKQYKC
eukprot:TRINITY_DN682_c0_g1_i1.p1 TRINITY_DN682_c0_g1~~TRINITY_DN682_c0_g1_i1.p1  ORF type:complete len:399 (-),score=30.19 TRINITY_DN682_c0_g1_i1:1475-2671(-)